MSDVRSKIFSALTGRQADVSGRADGDLRGMLMAVGGASSRTRSGIDLTKAAGKLGVSRRTVERWVQSEVKGAGQRPSKAHGQNLARKARQAATTKAGRRATIASSGIAAKISRGARISISGVQGPHEKSYMRKRRTQLDLDPGDAQAMLDAWENGGEKGFLGWAGDHWGNEYLDDWRFAEVDAIDIERPSGGVWR